MKEKIHKLNTSTKNLFGSVRRNRVRSLLILVALALLVTLGVSAYITNKKATRQQPQVACDQLAQESQKIYQSTARTPEDAKAEYDKLQQSDDVCGNRALKSKSDSELLKYNRAMAISAYSFGNNDKANEYANTAIELNEKVEDSNRQDLASREVVKAEMEAIKNGNY